MNAADLIADAPSLEALPAFTAAIPSLIAVNLADSSPIIGAAALAITTRTLTAATFAVGSPVIPSTAISQRHVLGSTSYADSLPIIGASMINKGLAVGYTDSPPVLGTPLLRIASSPFSLSIPNLVIGKPIMGMIVRASALAVSSPILNAATLSKTLRAVGLSVGSPFDQVPPLIVKRDPRARLLRDDDLEDDGSLVMEGIYSNYNDAIQLDVDGGTLVGSSGSSSDRGPAQRIEVVYPLVLSDKLLSTDATYLAIIQQLRQDVAGLRARLDIVSPLSLGVVAGSPVLAAAILRKTLLAVGNTVGSPIIGHP